MNRARRRCATACLFAVVALAGCGSTDHTNSSQANASAPAASQATVRVARCMLWNVLDQAARRRLILGLRTFFSQPLDNGAHLRVLPDDRAYQLLTSYCKLPFARAFLLYRLYGNAIGFTPAR